MTSPLTRWLDEQPSENRWAFVWICIGLVFVLAALTGAPALVYWLLLFAQHKLASWAWG